MLPSSVLKLLWKINRNQANGACTAHLTKAFSVVAQRGERGVASLGEKNVVGPGAIFEKRIP